MLGVYDEGNMSRGTIHWILVYTKTVDSVFHVLWLATQSVDILYYSPIHLQFLRASDGKVA